MEEFENGPALTRVTITDQTIRIVDVVLGDGVSYPGGFVNLYGCTIGAGTRIGPFVEIQAGAEVGVHCKISSHTFICDGVRIGDEVFIGHGVMFVNDRRPRAAVDGRMVTDEWTRERTYVQARASIGSNATIMCGVTIGPDAVVGAGAVVIRDVPPGQTVVGNPAGPVQERA